MDTCGICRDRITDNTKIDECGHSFCFLCIVQWANQSNSCPLCQCRFLTLSRLDDATKSTVSVKPVDRRERNALEVLEQFDSEEQSVDDDESRGSEADYMEEDWVVPDHIVVREDGAILDMREVMDLQAFGKVKRGQKDCIFKNAHGENITIAWLPSQFEDDDEEGDFVPKDDEDDEDSSVSDLDASSSFELSTPEQVKVLHRGGQRK